MLVGNQNPGTSTALLGPTGGQILVLKPCYVPVIPGPQGARSTNDWCITTGPISAVGKASDCISSDRPCPVEIDSEIFLLRVVVSYKRNYVHKVLVICFVKIAQEKVWLGGLTVST